MIDEGGRADLDSAAAQHVFAAMPSATSDPRRRLRAEQSLPRFEPCLPRRAHRSCLSGGHRWLKIKNPEAPAVRREAEEDWSGKRMTGGGRSALR